MDKQIPIYFDSVIIDSPFQEISQGTPNIGRLKVRVFTKYGNRNGSYITEAVADQLINSACNGNTPVVGFFDPDTQSWASHTGPTLANAYGYVEDFLGWQPFEDTDGITREYAVFSVVLFTDYFNEAQKILGQNQSMELDPNSITGDWARIEDNEYFVYTTAKMLGFCIIGEHEPCFSVSSFFAKNDDAYISQYEKFSSLLSDLKMQVKEAENNQKGGEQPMNEFENQEAVEETPSVVVDENVTENEVTTEFTAEEANIEAEAEIEVVEESQQDTNSDFELLQQQFNELQVSFNELQQQYSTAQEKINEFEAFQTTANTEIETLRNQNAELQASIQTYEAKIEEVETSRKNNLIEKYEKVMSEEEIKPVREKLNDFSYEELESRLAIIFANSKMAGGEVKKVPLPEPQESQFALLMSKYRKN